MKKLCLWLCPLALVALGTSARAGEYEQVPTNPNNLDTFYAPAETAAAVSMHAPRINPANPTGPMLGGGMQQTDSGNPGISRQTWVWNTTDPANEPAPSENFRCSYTLSCNVEGTGTAEVGRSQGTSEFKVEDDINLVLNYYKGVSHGSARSNLPYAPNGMPISQWTQYSNGTPQLPYPGDDGLMFNRSEAKVSVERNEAYISGADAPENAQASAGQASIQITDFDCADAHSSP